MATPQDKVQLQKQESAAGGGDAADSDDFLMAPLDPNEDAPELQGVFFQPPAPSTSQDENVYITRDGSDNLVFRDPNANSGAEASLTDLLATAGGGITEAQHEGLDTLTHDIVETSFEEYLYSGNKVTDIIIWTDNGKTQKVRESSFTYTGSKVTTIVLKQYDGAGALKDTVTETLSYTGNQLDDIDRVNS